MLDFLRAPAGQIVFGFVAAIVILIVIDVNYRYFTKTVLDIIFAFIAVILCSPVLVAGAIISRKNSGKVLETKAYPGVKGKIVYLHSFAGIKGGIEYLPRLFDVLCGRLSFVGVKQIELSDCPLMDDGQMERFSARAGLICHLCYKGGNELTYEEMFDMDISYAKHRELFTDIYIVLKRIVSAVRSDGKGYRGEPENGTYAEALLARGAITETDVKRAAECAAEAVAERDKRIKFKERRFKQG